jgi:hypothetical protein
MTLYTVRNIQGSATGLPESCLQCKKMVVPMVSLEVVDGQGNAIGYLHAQVRVRKNGWKPTRKLKLRTRLRIKWCALRDSNSRPSGS